MTKKLKPTLIDKAVSYIAPIRGMKRMQARFAMSLAEGYVGGGVTRRTLADFKPYGSDADSAINPQLDRLRNRSSWLVRNNPLSVGAINTVSTNAVGTGLKLQCRIDREILGLDDEAASAWESDTERKFRLFAESEECDLARTSNLYAKQDIVMRSALEKGDVFAGLVHLKRRGSPYGLKIQLIEAERISNPNNTQDTEELSAGVEKGKHGDPIAYHVLNQHPGNFRNFKGRKWERVPAFNSTTGRRVFLHIYRPTRPGQTRGVPYLAPVIEILLQLGRYTESEAKATLIASLFTVFVTTPGGDGAGNVAAAATDNPQAVKSDEQLVELEGGTIIDLRPGEEVQFANPLRPNTAFDAFVLSLARQIGVALEIPYEILIKHFTASYSASRGALLEAWKFYLTRRQWLVQKFCNPVYGAWMDEGVATGYIAAPGYFQDPFVRQAYLGSMWEGPTMPQIDPLKEIKASREKIESGISTIQEETVKMTGGDWDTNHPQSIKEHKARQEAGLIEAPPGDDTTPEDAAPDDGGNDSDKEKPDDAD